MELASDPAPQGPAEAPKADPGSRRGSLSRPGSRSQQARSDGRVIWRGEEVLSCTSVAVSEAFAVVGCEDGSARSTRLRLRGSLEAFLRGADAGGAGAAALHRPQQLAGHSAAVTACVVVDEQLIVTASLEGTLKSWDAATGRLLHTNDAHTEAVHALAWDEPSESLLSASADASVRAWKLRTNVSSSSLVHVFAAPLSAVATASLRPQGGGSSTVFVGTNNGRICGADVDSNDNGASYHAKGHTGRVSALCVVGTTLYSASRDGTVRVWQLPHPDGAPSDGAAISFFCEATRVIRPEGSEPIECLVALHSGAVLLTGSADGVIRRLEGDEGEETGRYDGHPGGVTALAVTPFGSLVSTGADLTLRQWDALDECEFCRRKCSRGECRLRVVQCPLPGCAVELQRRHLPEHVKVCPTRPGVCPHHGCGQRVPAGDLEAHSQQCGFRTQPCEHKGCTEAVVARFVAEHELVCCWRRERCSNDGCRVMLPVIELAPHGNDCQHRMVECPNEGCAKRVVLLELDAHVGECPFQRVPCEYFGCDAQLSGKEILTHPFMCRWQPVDCPLGCEEPLVLHRIGAHKREDCALQPVPCPNGCDAELLRRDLASHDCTTPETPEAPPAAKPAPAPAPRPRRRASTGHIPKPSKVKKFVAFGTTARLRASAKVAPSAVPATPSGAATATVTVTAPAPAAAAGAVVVDGPPVSTPPAQAAPAPAPVPARAGAGARAAASAAARAAKRNNSKTAKPAGPTRRRSVV